MIKMFHRMLVDQSPVGEPERRGAGATEEATVIKGTRFALLKNPWNLTRDEGRKLSDVQDNNAQLFRARAVLSRPERDKWWCQCWKPIPRSAGDAVVLFETKYFFSRFVRTYDLPP